jgi:hypothetical protein
MGKIKIDELKISIEYFDLHNVAIEKDCSVFSLFVGNAHPTKLC